MKQKVNFGLPEQLYKKYEEFATLIDCSTEEVISKVLLTHLAYKNEILEYEYEEITRAIEGVKVYGQ